MTSWTAHLKAGRQPVLVREGWSWLAFILGPIWLAFQRAWIPALLLAAILVLSGTLPPLPARGPVNIALLFLNGLLGRDLVRWSLARRGYLLAHVLAARDEEAALGRLLHYRPDVAAGLAGLLR